MQGSRRRHGGFTILELMVAVAVVGILAAMAVYAGTRQVKRATRVEVTMGLAKIREAQSIHFMEHGAFASSFNALVFKTDSGHPVSEQVYQGKVYQYTLSNPWGEGSYYVSAVGNLDGDEFLDMWVLEAGRPR